MTTLDAVLREGFDAYKRLVDDTEPILTALDERSGDGDFGANLKGGLESAADRAGASDGLRTWNALSEVFLDDVGGTSGPLFGLLFQEIREAAASADSLEALLRDGAGAGLAAVQRVGEAQPGDRTLVDALEPGVTALRDHEDLALAVAAAVDGAISTRDLIARRGRASYVGGRAVGFPDPGAVGIALLFVALGRASGLDIQPALDRLIRASDGSGSGIPEESPTTPEPTAESELNFVLDAATDARHPLAALSLEERAQVLETVADALETHSEELVQIAVEETHLTAGRLTGELGRTSFQLRLFAEVVRDGGFLDVRIDPADPSWPVAARPDLRRSNRPIGPVLVFAASNFPFAFSVLGGDTASALAAGNPVVVKAHPGHLHLSRRVTSIAADAIRRAGGPDGTIALIEGHDNGVAALEDPRVKAAAFTGSIAGGRALFNIAQNRPEPIPFYGELGSNNPVFVTPDADADAPEQIATDFIASFTLGAGQFCTKPGTLFVPTGSAVAKALHQQQLPGAAPLLNDNIHAGFQKRLTELRNAPNVRTFRAEGDPEANPPAPILLHAHGKDVLNDPELYLDECFGPAALIVEYDSHEQMLELARAFPGQLTATVFGLEDAPADLLDVLAERAGRLLWRQWPTGVSVTAAQQHGGPYPASTTSQTTSVGTAAIFRFLRPVAWQGFPQNLLPAELADK
ncbi:aldehyde dehydrogenase family protein [Leucobacter sp. wl10]|uniref:aldehyde dehydrogenase family protein n=1 Tax=Leucobacter sp. wl10 TaxID=2304677 RepID=UPI0013C33DD3|nr:aldehyde dehydrogenase family protein [Leucobacter sp. wl10]